ncbi:response regulator transcription factor [Chloroflexota bacterium]
MPSIFVISEENEAVAKLGDELAQSYFVNLASCQDQTVAEKISRKTPDLVLLELDGLPEAWELARWMKQDTSVPIIALVSRDTIDSMDGDTAIDDFLISPYDAKELKLRIKRLLNGSDHGDDEAVIRRGNLTIDQNKCEVSVKGSPVILTFREYELLKFLASNPGRVFTRDALLNEVWGYDYYGGDRTVDVHIRRLRSKIESSEHVFIETVRNIGYKFSAAAGQTGLSCDT